MSGRVFGELPAVDPELIKLLKKPYSKPSDETLVTEWQHSWAPALNIMSKVCHEKSDRFWRDLTTGERKDRNKGETLMLIVSEIAEAMEGERKDLMDDHLPNRKMVEVELADALIRIFDYAGGFGYDIGGALVEKMQYNETREDHSNAARSGINGKKW